MTPRFVSDDGHKFGVNEAYLKALTKNGAKAYILTLDYQSVNDYALEFDGLLICGGDDVTKKCCAGVVDHDDPDEQYRQDLFEIEMIRAFQKARKPILGICRGLQIYNIYKHGTLFNDIDRDFKDLRGLHNPAFSFEGYRHEVEIAEDSLLYHIVGSKCLKVNSFHHQSVKELGQGLKVSAISRDGVIEAIEEEGFIGLQWHPEKLHDEASSKIFQAFIDQCL